MKIDIKILEEWITSKNRKPSNIAFTDDIERRLASLIEEHWRAK